jgi:hypothetical protein
MKEIIAKLEQQRDAIERALSALRGVEAPREGKPASASASAPASEPAPPAGNTARGRRKGRLTPEGRRRLAEAMKRRWAVKRTAAQAKKSARKQ